ncbi:glycosyltransferase [Lachnospiraceae bacterium C1.1]|nr:glycosyltransferase [Lachnospiraceae bacterium C1.1]
MTISFIVLHYQEEELTNECVNSIMNLDTDGNDIKIVIVDNASPNQSGLSLKNRYKNDDRVNVIINKCNEGFAKGNNLGYRLAKNNNSDFILLVNNDVVFYDKSFIIKLVNEYNIKKFGVIGPDVYVPSENIHQNPAVGFDCTIKNVNKKIFRYYVLLVLNFVGICNVLKRLKITHSTVDYLRDQVITPPYILHGSCLIFSREYIDRYNGLCEKTYMYFEENILAYICFKDGVLMRYSPELKILHYRKGSTKGRLADQRKKNMFFYSNAIKSLRVLKDLIKKGKNCV